MREVRFLQGRDESHLTLIEQNTYNVQYTNWLRPEANQNYGYYQLRLFETLIWALSGVVPDVKIRTPNERNKEWDGHQGASQFDSVCT